MNNERWLWFAVCMAYPWFIAYPERIMEMVAIGLISCGLGGVVWVVACEADRAKRQAEREGRQ